jgi:hypothetical protein
MTSKILHYLKAAVMHPATHANLMMVGVLIMIGILHNHAHFSMDQDADSYVRQWCRSSDENKKICRSYSEDY